MLRRGIHMKRQAAGGGGARRAPAGSMTPLIPAVAASNGDTSPARALERGVAARESRLRWRAAVGLCVYLGIGTAGMVAWGDVGVVDGLYFSVVSLTTVGYGDITMTSDAKRLYVAAYLLIGVALVAGALSSVLDLLLSRHEQRLAEALESTLGVGEVRRDVTAPAQRGFIRRLCAAVTVSVLVALLMGVIGLVVMSAAMGWSFEESVYWVVVTMTTVGYGDVTPTTTGTRIFAIVFIPVSTYALGKAIADVAEARSKKAERESFVRILRQQLDKAAFSKMDRSGDGRVDRFEFLASTLLKQKKLTKEELDVITARFDEIDVDNTGFIEREEVA